MIVALDLETTWLDKSKDKIIEVALVKFDEKTFEVIETFDSLVNPVIPIPDLSSNITWITDEMVANSPKLSDLSDKIKEFIWDYPILWHNTYFDRDFLISNWIDISKNVVLDTFFLANILVRWEKSLSLESLSDYLELWDYWAHRALNDTINTVKLFAKLVGKIKAKSKEKRELLSSIFYKTKDKNIVWLREYLSLELALGEEDFIKILLKVIKKIDKTSEVKLDETLNIDFSNDYFSKFPNFEIRENQKIMANSVIEAFEKNKKIMIEAPTWVGKTFAYLLPSILYSLKNWEKVFISTSSKALQDQIIYKDLEFFKENLWFDFSFCKLKWRRNYLSVYSFFDLYHQNEILDMDEIWFFSKLVLWLYDTEEGELDEINFYPGEFQHLRKISADNSFVLKDTNPYKPFEYILKARTKATKSNIVVINHSLLLNDIVNDNAILWNISNLVVDERHNLEDSATDAFKNFVSFKAFDENLAYIEKINLKLSQKIKDFSDIKDSLLLNFTMIFDLFSSYFYQKQFGNTNREFLIWNDFFLNAKDAEVLIKNMEQKWETLLKNALDLEDKVFASLEQEIGIIREIINTLKNILNSQIESSQKYIKVVWLNDKTGIYVYSTLLHPGDFLRENLWYKLDSCILTSATLRIWEDFSYISKILRLDEIFSFSYLNSDFDYSKQALLFIPNDLGKIKANNNTLITNFLEKLFRIVKWRSLVLFTSYQSIKDSYVWLNNNLKKDWTTIYAQSIGWSKHKLLEQFRKKRETSVLFWTDSFWEWVDIAGKDLETLVIYKFPFAPPNDPIFLARSKLFADSFSDYSIPKAIIKLKQWFWRLIRTKNDKWIVILLDDRIFSSNWGEKMFLAFPENINRKVWNSDNFLEILKKREK